MSFEQDLAAGFTHYLCPIDDNGHEGACSTLTKAQYALALKAIGSTPIGAEDRIAGYIRAIDPKARVFMGMSRLPYHLGQSNAIRDAIIANPSAGTPEPPGPSPTTHKQVDFGVRILEGLAAVAGVGLVVFEIWKHARKRAA